MMFIIGVIMMHDLLVYVVMCTLVMWWLCKAQRSFITLGNNGYEGMQTHINPYCEGDPFTEAQAKDILDDLQVY